MMKACIIDRNGNNYFFLTSATISLSICIYSTPYGTKLIVGDRSLARWDGCISYHNVLVRLSVTWILTALLHFSGVTISSMASQSPASLSFAQPFVQTQIKERVKLRVTGLCEGNPLVTGGFPSQRASNTPNVSILMTSSCSRQQMQMS